ncbi:pentapeptide repeat-containing protein [Methanosarcina vacuolata]|uniref:pentapeptide repeat-containing protein n=1 Tax=Methanosarcina vacuolata TaxID=2215 RepID=UPI001E3B793F|nr:pentapeptide repeat-containing protein [Methanosarcina vacuolata]
MSLIITILGVIVGIISLYYTRKQTHVTENQASATDKSIIVTQENQITEHFTRAVEQLGAVDKEGNPAIEIRLGAISSLKIIADKSDEYYWPIMENLTAYLRKNSQVEYGERTFHFEYSNAHKESIEIEDRKMQDRVSLDIHAIITVIRRRRCFFNSDEDDHLDLRETNLREANFQGANLQGANLKWAYLGGANFREANLQDADLEDANLQEVVFVDADLSGANLTGTYLKGANLVDAKLKGVYLIGADFRKAFLQGINLQGAIPVLANFERVDLEGANLEDADLMGANLDRTNLKDVNLSGANLERTYLGGAYFEGTNLEGASLKNANLEYAKLKEAKKLTVDQLSKAKTLYKAELDEGLEEEVRAKGFGSLLDENPKNKNKEPNRITET